ncbi:MAG: BrnT family toxin [bacterium]
MRIRTTWRIKEKLIKKHGIEIEEVKEALNNDESIYVQKGKFNSSLIYSRTEAGRYLFTVAIIDWRAKDAFIITSRDMTNREKVFYRRKKGILKKG